MAQLSVGTTVNSDAAATDALVSRVEIASRGLLTLSARAGMNLPDGISLAQLRALAAADDAGPCTVSALADVLMISTSSASRLVDRLTASGVLDRRTSEFSRREVTLQVTARGRRILRRHEAARRDVFAGVMRHMTATDVRALIRGLEAVRRHVDERTPMGKR